MKKNAIKKLAVFGIITSLLSMAGFHGALAQDEKSQMAELTIANGSIAITQVPSDFNFDTVFIPPDNDETIQLYKTLEADTPGSIVKVRDTDESGRNFKVTMSVSNFSSETSIIPFTSFSAVTLAKDTVNGIDRESGTVSWENVTTPIACEWGGSNGNTPPSQPHPLSNHCNTELSAENRKFKGSGTAIGSDPTSPVITTDDTVTVGDSTDYDIGEIIVMGSIPMGNLEYLIVTSRPSATSIQVKRGVSDTSRAAHTAASGITKWGNISDEIDILVAPEPAGKRIGVYSVGLGLKTLIEPDLELMPGDYTGSINFTLYECNDLSCI